MADFNYEGVQTIEDLLAMAPFIPGDILRECGYDKLDQIKRIKSPGLESSDNHQLDNASAEAAFQAAAETSRFKEKDRKKSKDRHRKSKPTNNENQMVSPKTILQRDVNRLHSSPLKDFNQQEPKSSSKHAEHNLKKPFVKELTYGTQQIQENEIDWSKIIRPEVDDEFYREPECPPSPKKDLLKRLIEVDRLTQIHDSFISAELHLETVRQLFRLEKDLCEFNATCNNQFKLCTFCYSNGDPKHIYSSHWVRDNAYRVTCPALYHVVCIHCRATGNEAHTSKTCPFRPGAEPVYATVITSTPMPEVEITSTVDANNSTSEN